MVVSKTTSMVIVDVVDSVSVVDVVGPVAVRLLNQIAGGWVLRDRWV